jgi:hypothetical protein
MVRDNRAMRTALICLAPVAFFWAIPASAAPKTDGENIAYTIRSGDTLIALGRRYFINAEDYRIVQKRNAIADPFRIGVGRVLAIPRYVLKYKPANAKMLAVRGRVSVGGTQAVVGQIISEGTKLTTAETSFATLLLDNGSRLSLPSNSDITISRLRTYVLGGSLDYDFAIGKGGARSSVTPLKSKDDRYKVRTPKAVSAVRGTDFQARYDPATDSDFAEVIEGGLAVGMTSKAPLALPAGNGLALPKSGNVILEALLAPPTFIKPGKFQADPTLLFTPTPDQNVSGFRYTISTDSSFIDQVADNIFATGPAEFRDIGDGNYFLRVRAISINGIQGQPATFAFKRRLNSVSATAVRDDSGFTFKWLRQGSGVSRFHFQLFNGPTDGTAMIDEAALDGDSITLSDLPPGEYQWRVGSVQYGDGEVAANWTAFEKLSVGEP